MEEKRTFSLSAQIVFGSVIVICGVLLMLDNFRVLEFGYYFSHYWPLLLVVFGGMKLLQARSQGRLWGGIIVAIGLIMLIDRNTDYEIHFWDFWPLILVAIGASMIIRRGTRRPEVPPVHPFVPGSVPPDTESFVNASAILGGSKRNIHTTDFRGGELTAIMGGCDIDLRNASIANSPAVLDVFALWGGMEIKVPQSWSVAFEGTPVLGGFDDKTFRQAGDPTQRLIIRGTVIMGGVEVGN